MRWLGNCLGWKAQRAVIGSTKSCQRSVSSGVSKELIQGPVLFNIFISDQDDGWEGTLSKLTDDTKLGQVADIPEVHASIQRDLDRLEKQADRNLTELNKVERQGMNNPRHQYTVVTSWLESNSSEKGFRVFVDSKLTISQQRRPTVPCMRKFIASRSRKVIFALSSAPGVLCPVQGSSVQERHERPGQSSEGPQRWLSNCSIFDTRRGWERWDCSSSREEKADKDIIHVDKCLMGGIKKMETGRGFFWAMGTEAVTLQPLS